MMRLLTFSDAHCIKTAKISLSILILSKTIAEVRANKMCKAVYFFLIENHYALADGQMVTYLQNL